MRLKADNKMYLHTESKLNDANLEIKQLSELIGQLSAINGGSKIGFDSEGKKNSDLLKMRQQNRKSVLHEKDGLRSAGLSLFLPVDPASPVDS